jgi:hypothetical protein
VESPGLAGGVSISGLAAIVSEPGAPLAQSGTESPLCAANAPGVNNSMASGRMAAADFPDIKSLFVESIHVFYRLDSRHRAPKRRIVGDNTEMRRITNHRDRNRPRSPCADRRFCLARAVAGNISACLLVLSFCAVARAQTCQPRELRVFVKDSQEAPIYAAKVRVGSDSVEVATLSTPASGLADFEQVACGAWTIKASKDGFEDSRAKIEITGEITGAPALEVTLTMNPETTRSSLDVSASTPPPVEQSSSQNYELHPDEVKNLPSNPATISDALPLVPGVVRAPNGELKLDGSGEQRSSLVVNESDVTDPATGKFGQTVPVDSIETVNVLNTPFLAQYGRFTQSVVAVETRRGGDKWHYDLNDPFPDFRIRSYHMRGISNSTPHAVVGGPPSKIACSLFRRCNIIWTKCPTGRWGFPSTLPNMSG